MHYALATCQIFIFFDIKNNTFFNQHSILFLDYAYLLPVVIKKGKKEINPFQGV